jgi:hypothetical protein
MAGRRGHRRGHGLGQEVAVSGSARIRRAEARKRSGGEEKEAVAAMTGGGRHAGRPPWPGGGGKSLRARALGAPADPGAANPGDEERSSWRKVEDSARELLPPPAGERKR